MTILVLILALLWAVGAANEEVEAEPKQNGRELLRRRHTGLRGVDEFAELIRLCRDGYYEGTLSVETMDECEDLLGYGLRRVDRYRDVSNRAKRARRRRHANRKKIKKLRKKWKKAQKRMRRKRRKRAIKRARRYRFGRDNLSDIDNWPLDIDGYDYP